MLILQMHKHSSSKNYLLQSGYLAFEYILQDCKTLILKIMGRQAIFTCKRSYKLNTGMKYLGKQSLGNKKRDMVKNWPSVKNPHFLSYSHETKQK